ncbi:MAG: GxxExxY protein [Proteobacteria bacterium]|nr:MAG: GxxExxY protein [Pseudomonadota bacterium]QKK10745.1 MAG: GxxExxY protein [Pseudomonadota bacterium]
MEAIRGVDPETEAVAKHVLDAAFRVHSELGPGLLESVYETCLTWELESQGIEVLRQVAILIRYRGRELTPGLRLDMVVSGQVIVETKAANALVPIHQAQLISYLKLANLRLSLLLNFNVVSMKDGIKRLVY